MKDNKTLKNNWKEPKYFMFFVFFCLFIIVVQLIYVSLFPNIYGINMKDFASKRNVYSTTLYAKRGTIYDNEGNPLALNVSSYTVIAYLSKTRTGSSKVPKHVVDVEGTAKALSPLINMSEEKLIELLSKKAYQVELGPGGRGITELVKKEIEKLNLPGIDFIETYKRYYPNGDFASYILGYAKSNEMKDKNGNVTTQIVGEMGLESKYNDLLVGTNGYLSYQRDRYGYKIPDTNENRVEAINGADVYLTLDSNVQRFAESAIRDIQATSNPRWGIIAVMNAKTGEILASSSIPSFDPNVRNIKNYQSPLVTYTYEPGSTMKVYSYMCAVDSGKYDGNLIVKSGSVVIGVDEIRDWNRVGWGNITLDRGFSYSSNVAASKIVQSIITKEEYRDCLEKYGFGETTGVELSKEASGTIKFTYPIEVATAAFGQGITTTVMQNLQGLSILANDGKRVKPRIVDKIVDPNTNEIIYESKLVKSEKLVKTSTVEKMKELMNTVVNGYVGDSSGSRYRTSNVTLVGKTGTAQIASPTGGYLTGYNDYTYSFTGMFPLNDPEVIIYGAIQQPTYGGSMTLATAVKEVVTNTAKYFNMTGTSSDNSNMYEVPLDSYISRDVEKVKTELQEKNVEVIVLGSGNKIISQYPQKGTKILSYDRVILMTNDVNIGIPNLKKWSKKEIVNLFEMININYNIKGSGYVVEQDIAPGTLINKDMTINVVLGDKYLLEGIN